MKGIKMEKEHVKQITLALMIDVLQDTEFPVGGIPEADKIMTQMHGFTDKQSADCLVRLWKIYRKMYRIIDRHYNK